MITFGAVSLLKLTWMLSFQKGFVHGPDFSPHLRGLPRRCRLDARARRLLLHLCRLLCGRGGCRDDRCGRRRCHAHGGYRQGAGGDSDQPPDHRERLLPRRVPGRGREARHREPLRPEQSVPRGAVRRHRGPEHHLGRDLAGDDRREAAGPHRHHHRGRLRQVRQDRADGLHRRWHAHGRGPVPLHRRFGGQEGRRRGLYRRVQRQGGHGERRDRGYRGRSHRVHPGGVAPGDLRHGQPLRPRWFHPLRYVGAEGARGHPGPHGGGRRGLQGDLRGGAARLRRRLHLLRRAGRRRLGLCG